jgi:hypothetical protein
VLLSLQLPLQLIAEALVPAARSDLIALSRPTATAAAAVGRCLPDAGKPHLTLPCAVIAEYALSEAADHFSLLPILRCRSLLVRSPHCDIQRFPPAIAAAAQPLAAALRIVFATFATAPLLPGATLTAHADPRLVTLTTSEPVPLMFLFETAAASLHDSPVFSNRRHLQRCFTAYHFLMSFLGATAVLGSPTVLTVLF